MLSYVTAPDRHGKSVAWRPWILNGCEGDKLYSLGIKSTMIAELLISVHCFSSVPCVIVEYIVQKYHPLIPNTGYILREFIPGFIWVREFASKHNPKRLSLRCATRVTCYLLRYLRVIVKIWTRIVNSQSALLGEMREASVARIDINFQLEEFAADYSSF